MCDNLLTIDSYLQGKIGFDVPERMIRTVLVDMGIPEGTPIEEVSLRDRDVSLSELLYSLITIPSIKGAVEDSDGNWKHKEGQTEFYATDKKAMLQRANDLREKWGLDKLGVTKISICSSGLYKRRLK